MGRRIGVSSEASLPAPISVGAVAVGGAVFMSGGRDVGEGTKKVVDSTKADKPVGKMVNDAAKKTASGPSEADGGRGSVGSVPKSPKGPGSVPASERDPRRLFSRAEVAAKVEEQGGLCSGCGEELDAADAKGHHIIRHADEGQTVPENLAALCSGCHVEVHR